MFGGLGGVGKTVPSYRMALETEIANWKSYRKALACDMDREVEHQQKASFFQGGLWLK